MRVETRAELMMSDSRQSRTLAVLIGVALVLHVASAFGLEGILKRYDVQPVNKLPKFTEVDLVQPPPPPEPPPTPEQPTPEPVRPEPEPVHRVVENAPPPPRNAPPPAPEPSRAAPIMVMPGEMSNDSQEEVATGDNVNATGQVSNDGVVRDYGVTGARHDGVGAGTGHAPAVVGPPPAPPPPDLSVHAVVDCDESSLRTEFPTEAAEAGITHMVVRVRMVVDASGHVTSATPINDPGYGFAAASTRLVRGEHCRVTPARDRQGHESGETLTFRVTFDTE